MLLEKVDYKLLNARQKENYNYQKIAALLAEYGYTTYRMHDDYNGSDFHAVHINGKVLKVQLKGRVSIHKKYLGKDIFIAFCNIGNEWYLYPHDSIYKEVTKHSPGAMLNEARSMNAIPKWLLPILIEYKL